jgi:hypothetical protein
MLALELVEDLSQRLADDVTENVHAPTMRHANDDFADAGLDELIKRNFEASDEGLATLNTKTLGGIELASQELLEFIRPDKAIIIQSTVFLGVNVVLKSFKLISDPVACLSGGYMHVLNTNLAAVGVLECINKFSKFPVLLSTE